MNNPKIKSMPPYSPPNVVRPSPSSDSYNARALAADNAWFATHEDAIALAPPRSYPFDFDSIQEFMEADAQWKYDLNHVTTTAE